MKKKNPGTYYPKVSAAVGRAANALSKEITERNLDSVLLCSAYFDKYWKEFAEFWSRSGEQPQRLNFYMPQNLHFVACFVWTEHKDEFADFIPGFQLTFGYDPTKEKANEKQ